MQTCIEHLLNVEYAVKRWVRNTFHREFWSQWRQRGRFNTCQWHTFLYSGFFLLNLFILNNFGFTETLQKEYRKLLNAVLPDPPTVTFVLFSFIFVMTHAELSENKDESKVSLLPFEWVCCGRGHQWAHVQWLKTTHIYFPAVLESATQSQSHCTKIRVSAELALGSLSLAAYSAGLRAPSLHLQRARDCDLCSHSFSLCPPLWRLLWLHSEPTQTI